MVGSKDKPVQAPEEEQRMMASSQDTTGHTVQCIRVSPFTCTMPLMWSMECFDPIKYFFFLWGNSEK